MRRRSGRRSRGRRRQRSQGRVTLGASLTGLMVAVSSTFVFSVAAGAVLEWQGHDLHKVVRGDTAWASAGAATAFVLAVFLSFLWGGYTAGRMGGGSGAKNGALVPGIAVLALGIAGVVTVGVRGWADFTFPFGVGRIPLDANFTPLGFALVAAVFACFVAGSIWGGIIGGRWHLKLSEDRRYGREPADADSFSDLSGGPGR